MGDVERLAEIYQAHIALPWREGLAGAERVLVVVYDRSRERAMRARLGAFGNATRSAGHSWIEVDVSGCFGEWLGAEEYREEYFAAPGDLQMKLESEFAEFVAARVRQALDSPEADAQAAVGVIGAGTLFGLTRVSRLMRLVESHIRGRLVIFFPGTLDRNNYRLLDARDGWSYLAVSITLHQGEID